VAVPAQTSLQEELPGDVRGRVFGVLNMLVSLASFVPIIVAGPLADVLSAAAVIIIFAAFVMIIGVASMVFAHPLITGSAHPTNVEPYDPMTITTASSTLNRPIRLRYIPEDVEGTRPIQIIASQVVPGKAGPAQERPPGPADG
jgi:membrane-associated protease RseP (regulator of RpoE activity)